MSDGPTGEQLDALVIVVEQVAGIAWDMAREGHAREQVVSAALMAIGRMVDGNG